MSYLENRNYNIPIAKKIFWLFTGRAMPVIILFLISVLYSRHLSYEDYGKFQSIWMYTNVVNVVMGFGLTSVILSSNLSFLFAFIKKNFTKLISFYTLLWAVVLVVFFIYGKNFNSSTKYLLILFIVIQNTATVLETLQIKNHNERFVFVSNFVYAVLFFIWHYYVLTHNYALDKLVTGIIIISVLKTAGMLYLKKFADVAGEVGEEKIFFRHWFYLGINDSFGVLAKWMDKLFLVYLLSAADFAVFFNGSFEIPLFSLLVSVAGSVLLIDISANTAVKPNVIKTFNEGFRILSLIVFPLFLYLFFFRTELFAVVFKHKYDLSIPVFLISIFILPVRINNYSSILQCYAAGNKIVMGSLLDIVIISVLMLILYPVMGTTGVALAIVTGTYCQAIFYLWQSAKVLGTGIVSLIPFRTLGIRMFILSLIFGCIFFLTQNLSLEVRLITGTIFTAGVILISVYFYFAKKSITGNVFTTKN